MFREHGDIPGKTRRGEKYALRESVVQIPRVLKNSNGS